LFDKFYDLRYITLPICSRSCYTWTEIHQTLYMLNKAVSCNASHHANYPYRLDLSIKWDTSTTCPWSEVPIQDQTEIHYAPNIKFYICLFFFFGRSRIFLQFLLLYTKKYSWGMKCPFIRKSTAVGLKQYV